MSDETLPERLKGCEATAARLENMVVALTTLVGEQGGTIRAQEAETERLNRRVDALSDELAQARHGFGSGVNVSP